MNKASREPVDDGTCVLNSIDATAIIRRANRPMLKIRAGGETGSCAAAALVIDGFGWLSMAESLHSQAWPASVPRRPTSYVALRVHPRARAAVHRRRPLSV